VKADEKKLAVQAFSVAEDGLLKLFQQQLVNTAFNLDTAASVFHGPQIKILQNLAALVGTDDQMVADAVIRWKCIYSELRAILLCFGAGKEYLKTFELLQVNNTKGLHMSESDLTSLAQKHKEKSNRIMQEYGQEVIACLFRQSCDQLQQMMRPDHLILEYCLNHPTEQPKDPTADSTHRGFLVALQPVGDALVREIDFTEVLQLARKWSALLPSARCEEHIQKVSSLGRRLCELLIPPDVQRLVDNPLVKRVIICPEASLSVLPLELLPFEDGQLLGEKCALVYLPAARELLRDSVVFAISTVFAMELNQQLELTPSDEPKKSDTGIKQDPAEEKQKTHDFVEDRIASLKRRLQNSETKECVIIADPDYEMEGESGGSIWESFVASFASVFTDDSAGDGTLVRPLPDTRKEAEEIYGILSASKTLSVNCLLGEKATLSAVLQVKSPFVLHFSTHGFSKPDSQAFRSTFWDDIKSGILLAGASTFRAGKFKSIATEAGTGELTSLAACGMDLQGTRLVYLSTCVSSYGSYSYGEAVNSLAQAFRIAGAKTVIATLWEVDSKAAVECASYFYEAACVIGTPPSLALSQAKKKIRDETLYDDQMHWSAFVCIGQDIPLFPKATRDF
jgi:CHAT domain-containing protein